MILRCHSFDSRLSLRHFILFHFAFVFSLTTLLLSDSHYFFFAMLFRRFAHFAAYYYYAFIASHLRPLRCFTLFFFHYAMLYTSRRFHLLPRFHAAIFRHTPLDHCHFLHCLLTDYFLCHCFRVSPFCHYYCFITCYAIASHFIYRLRLDIDEIRFYWDIISLILIMISLFIVFSFLLSHWYIIDAIIIMPLYLFSALSLSLYYLIAIAFFLLIARGQHWLLSLCW